ncbi:MAG: hypothetical protein R3F19_04100 [Verrucomicrobiales bacterium]
MNEQNESAELVRLYRGNSIQGIGFPLVVTAKYEYDPNFRRVEVYVFVVSREGVRRLSSKKYSANSIPKSFIDDASLMDEIKGAAQAELDVFVYEEAKRLGREVVRFDARFTLEEIDVQSFRFCTIRHGMSEEIRFIHNHSDNDLLKGMLPRIPRYPSKEYSIEEEEIKET